MASKEVQSRNRSVKNRTGYMTIRRRKAKGMKAKPWGKQTPPGVRPSPTDVGNRKLSGTKKKKD